MAKGPVSISLNREKSVNSLPAFEVDEKKGK
jgi:hypothetical protein